MFLKMLFIRYLYRAKSKNIYVSILFISLDVCIGVCGEGLY